MPVRLSLADWVVHCGHSVLSIIALFSEVFYCSTERDREPSPAGVTYVNSLPVT